MAAAEAKSDKHRPVRVRSLLFLPASNPRAIAKAREAGADLVVLDLEDAVKPEDKEAARAGRGRCGADAWPMPVAIRINGVGTEWHSLDLDASRGPTPIWSSFRARISAHLVGDVAETLGKPVLAMIETAAGVVAAADIAQTSRADRRHQRSSRRPAPAARCDARADLRGAPD